MASATVAISTLESALPLPSLTRSLTRLPDSRESSTRHCAEVNPESKTKKIWSKERTPTDESIKTDEPVWDGVPFVARTPTGSITFEYGKVAPLESADSATQEVVRRIWSRRGQTDISGKPIQSTVIPRLADFNDMKESELELEPESVEEKIDSTNCIKLDKGKFSLAPNFLISAQGSLLKTAYESYASNLYEEWPSDACSVHYTYQRVQCKGDPVGLNYLLWTRYIPNENTFRVFAVCFSFKAAAARCEESGNPSVVLLRWGGAIHYFESRQTRNAKHVRRSILRTIIDDLNLKILSETAMGRWWKAPKFIHVLKCERILMRDIFTKFGEIVKPTNLRGKRRKTDPICRRSVEQPISLP